ncbi:MAG: MATE family efflux transporter [Arenibacter sp.]
MARRVGEKNLQGARESAVQVIILGITVAIITGIFGAIYSKEILGLMGGSSELIEEGHGYTQLMIGGNITILLL